MDSPFARVFVAADCRTQEELASLLGIRQSAISDAKRRGSVPSEWLVNLFRLRNVNPEWVLTGCGPRFLDRGSGTDSAPQRETKKELGQDVLRHFSSKALADELVRRTSGQARGTSV